MSKGDGKLEDAGPYQRLIENILYVNMTRTDIKYAIHTLCKFIHCPQMSHMESTLRVLKYIMNISSVVFLRI